MELVLEQKQNWWTDFFFSFVGFVVFMYDLNVECFIWFIFVLTVCIRLMWIQECIKNIHFGKLKKWKSSWKLKERKKDK